MVHIKELKLKNFKSFPNAVTIPFYDDFTTISGPNGSGKSNVIDGVVFGLGLSTSKTMRAEKLTDLVYSNNGYTADHAEVSIKFDNSDREMPIDEDEIVITRKIKLTENGYYSQFYFNGKPCSLTDVHNNLFKIRISPETYNVIMQGDVTQITKMTSRGRRKIIDEVAGVSEFDERKEKALGELDIVKNRIDRADMLMEEVAVRLEQLKDERKQALKYQKLRDDKKHYESMIALSRLRNVESEIAGKKQELEGVLNRKDVITKELSETRENLVASGNDLQTLNGEINTRGEQDIIQIKKDIEESIGEISRCSNLIEICTGEMKSLDTERVNMLVQVDQLQGQIKEQNNKLNQESVRKSGLVSELERFNGKLKNVSERIEKTDSKYTDQREELLKLKDELEEIRNGKNEILRERDRFMDVMRRRAADVEEISKDMESDNMRSSEILINHENLQSEIHDMDARIKSTNEDISDLESKRVRTMSEMNQVDQTLRSMQEEYARSEVKINAANEMGGYSGAVKEVLDAKSRRVLQGIYGTIADMGRVDEKHSAALEVAAGARMQCVVVDDDEDAAGAIEHLKKLNAGRATFLPINKMRGLKNQINSLDRGVLKSIKGAVGYAIDLVEYDGKFDAAFWYVFRDTLVMDKLDNARKAINKFRIVTLDGELLEKGGAMTGGSKARSRFKFAADAEKKLTELAERISVQESQRRSLINELDDIEGHISSMKNEIEALERDADRKKLAIEEFDDRVKRAKDEIDAKKKKLEAVDEERKHASEKVMELEKQIREEDNTIHEMLSGIRELDEKLAGSEISRLMGEAEDARAEIQRIENRIRDVDTSIKTITLERDNLEMRLGEIKSKVSVVDGKKQEYASKIDGLRKEITVFEEKVGELRSRENEIGGKISELREARDRKLVEITQLEQKRDEFRISLERIEDGTKNLNVIMEELQKNLEEIQKDIEITDIPDDEEIPPYDEIVKRISSLEARMEGMEPVNMRAITEYDAVERRQNNMRSKCDTLSKEREEIIERIENYEKMKKQTFMDVFDKVDANFRDIFAELSGGSGELILEDAEDPFAGGLTIKASTSGKSFLRLEALSGGEKSLTALSLLFAIQRTYPSPFYALDEIDMFLDGVNVERVAKMIKKLSGEAQFIVVSLREPMIDSSDCTIGVIKREKNVSEVTGIRLT